MASGESDVDGEDTRGAHVLVFTEGILWLEVVTACVLLFHVTVTHRLGRTLGNRIARLKDDLDDTANESFALRQVALHIEVFE